MYLQINKHTILPILIAIGLMVAIVVKVAVDGTWCDNIPGLALGLGGGFTFLFTDTVAETFERERPHEEWFQESNTWVKVAGGLSVVSGALLVFGVV
ncbi:MAG: hypothetical protein AAF711_16630 [Planctomycetota bacterium]